MSSVLARPGAPTIRLLPPTNSVISTWSMTSSWPMMILCSSVRICWRPAFILSASAMSSGDCRSTASLTVACRVSLIGNGLRSENAARRLLAFGRADLARLQREGGHQFLELSGVARRRHRFLQQPMRLDAALQFAPFEIQRAQSWGRSAGRPSPTVPSETMVATLPSLAGRRWDPGCLPCRRCRRGARARWPAAPRARRPGPPRPWRRETPRAR